MAAPLDLTPEPPLRPLRILLVEDSPDNRTIIAAYLEYTPYRVEIAETGTIACEKFKSGVYDLVLMDRQMPGMDGLTATRAIRAWERANGRQSTPILALTASALKGDREACLAAGCTAFLTKPIKQDVLLRAIRKHSLPEPVEVGLAAPAPGNGAPIVVHTEAAFAHLIPSYLRSCRNEVRAMEAALDGADFAALGALGHNMSGSGGAYGFQAITDLGNALQESASSADDSASRRWVSELDSYLKRVEFVSDL